MIPLIQEIYCIKLLNFYAAAAIGVIHTEMQEWRQRNENICKV